MSDITNDNLLELFIVETNQMLEKLEDILLFSEKNLKISKENLQEIFRIMHTIKGSSAIMEFNNISSLAHAVEDLYDYIRNNPNFEYDKAIDITLSALDFIKFETSKIESGEKPDGCPDELIKSIKKILGKYKKSEFDNESEKCSNPSFNNDSLPPLKYHAKLYFDEDCRMVNMYAFTVVFNLKDICSELCYQPDNIENDNSCCDYIIENGFDIYFDTDESLDKLNDFFKRALCVKSFEIKQIDNSNRSAEKILENKVSPKNDNQMTQPDRIVRSIQDNMINVNISKLDTLLDLVGEIVITYSMVIKNSKEAALNSEGFNKSARQLKKLIEELSDNVMSVRMVSVAPTFNKMNRIVRDMSKKLNKEVVLNIKGEDTEIDKNIINHLSDPLMHIIRNSMDHGIEDCQTRLKMNKPKKGTITLEAKNDGGEVLIIVTDDGAGLNREKILKKAKSIGILSKNADELSDREVYNLILKSGFSTKDNVSEYSGRGVGMDVVKNNIEKIGGRIFIDSIRNKGTTVYIRIPMTLSIIDGMKVCVGENIFIIPTISVREFLKINADDVIVDSSGNEMILIREKCYPVIRLHKFFNINSKTEDFDDGIVIVVESDDKSVCLFADELLNEQQVVIKPLPHYLMQFFANNSGISGCAILDDGKISLVIGIKEILEQY